ncbi:uncharacterized protein BT62DRAFT_470965 [Guyanagaster necrorhizus]|uniref:Uncharacterized protein n=1 Tax=Guyanagaster necrorhizus TaxID=856835 RepID=A0A9P8APB7_9AGAR|nr:uncharacterized protein BT62DRAFT_470965 [Guyanagaster necrorhizus MCA 3950]KAG7441697.1 hypothetical protein BT62DRAFT_470965 [Guyanagaster necrorhizus MCA 3950]
MTVSTGRCSAATMTTTKMGRMRLSFSSSQCHQIRGSTDQFHHRSFAQGCCYSSPFCSGWRFHYERLCGRVNLQKSMTWDLSWSCTVADDDVTGRQIHLGDEEGR